MKNFSKKDPAMLALGCKSSEEFLELFAEVLSGETLAIQRGPFTITSAGRENFVSVLLAGAEIFSLTYKDGKLEVVRSGEEEMFAAWRRKFGPADLR